MRGGLLSHQLVHARPRLQLLEWRRRADHLDAGRSGTRLAAHHLRLHAQLRQQLRVSAAVGTRRQMASRGRHWQSPGRLAGDGRVFGDLRDTDRLHRERDRLCARRATRIRPTPPGHRTCSAASARADSGSIHRCFPRRREPMGQRRAAWPLDGTCVCEPGRVDREDYPVRNAGAPKSGRTCSTR